MEGEHNQFFCYYLILENLRVLWFFVVVCFLQCFLCRVFFATNFLSILHHFSIFGQQNAFFPSRRKEKVSIVDRIIFSLLQEKAQGSSYRIQMQFWLVFFCICWCLFAFILVIVCVILFERLTVEMPRPPMEYISITRKCVFLGAKSQAEAPAPV